MFARLQSAIDEADDPVDGLIEAVATGLELARSHPLAQHSLGSGSSGVFAALGEGNPSSIARLRAFFTAAIPLALPSPARRGRAADDIADTLVHLLLGYAVIPEVSVNLSTERTRRAYATNVVTGLLAGWTR